MLIRAEDGEVYNVAYVAGFRIGESSTDAKRKEAKEKPFYIEVVREGTSAPLRIKTILARFATREEADKALNLIVKQSGGVNLGPKQSPETYSSDVPRSTVRTNRSFN